MENIRTNEFKVSSPKPYPQVAICKPNIKYAQILSQNFASPKSEFTTISQYIYQNLVLSSCYKEIAETIQRIAVVEMHHLSILGQLIVLLGGCPKYQATCPHGSRVWNGNMVNYNTNIKQILHDNVIAEQKAYDTYISQAEYINDENICALLERMAMDEKIHVDIFSKYLCHI